MIDPLSWPILPRIPLGPLAISPHGLGIALGVLAGARLGIAISARTGGPDETHIWNGLFYSLLGAIAGARIGYVLGHIEQVTEGGSDPLGVLKIWEGGISLLGGITGAVLAAIPYMRHHGIPFWQAMDFVAPGLALGIVIGRVGDLVIGDHLGTPTAWALGWRCSGEVGGGAPISASQYEVALAEGSPPSLGCYDIALHQTALYDLISTAVLLGLLIVLGRRALRGGALALVFTTWYGSMRLITDWLRVDRRYGGLTGSQILAGVVVLLSLGLLARYRGAPPKWGDRRYERPPLGQATEDGEPPAASAGRGTDDSA